jgi:hypothetical protein
MTKTQAAHVINATVRLDNLGGQGVLVPGGFILSAAHCIQWDGEVGMAMGDRFIESITTKSGARLGYAESGEYLVLYGARHLGPRLAGIAANEESTSP